MDVNIRARLEDYDEFNAVQEVKFDLAVIPDEQYEKI